MKNAVERRKRQTRLNVRAHRLRKQQKTFQSNSFSTTSLTTTPCYRPAQPLIGWSCKDEYWDRVDIAAYMTPLSSDHRLLVLVSYNVLRGIHTNLNILALHHLVTMECRRGIGLMPLFPAPSMFPPSLVRTKLQNEREHGEWIDLIPCPIMRDNAIRLEGTFDHDSLCSDVIGGLYEGWKDTDIETNGMLVWSDPWDVNGWELTEGFVKKWGCLVQGCHGMIAATNRWRALRGDKPLAVEL